MDSNVELIKKFYDLFKKGDKQYLQLCADDIEWNAMKGMPNGGKYIGKKAVFDEYFPRLFSNFTEFHAVTEQFMAAGDTVVVIGRYHGIAKTGKKFDAPFAHIYTIEKDTIVRFKQYTDTLQIREAMS